MANQPNMFNFATSELTQDAFITWLLHWANPKYKAKNEKLHDLGTSFLASLLVCQDLEITDKITDFQIQQQFHKIDIFISFKMNDCTYGIIIEDKVHTTDHSNQLERYVNKITELKTCNVLVPIYFKTGYQVNLSRIAANNYHHYSIKDFLKVLAYEKVYEINNDVLIQYHSYLVHKEVAFDSAEQESYAYLTKPLNDWKWWSCVRFFHDYKKHFNANWSSVANNREPLLAFWFGGKALPSINANIGIYVDIVFKNKKLHINYRIYLKEKAQINRDTRNNIYDSFVPFLKNNGIETRRAKYTKAKETMLLAEITNLDGNINYLAFVKKIEHYQNVLNEYVDIQAVILV